MTKLFTKEDRFYRHRTLGGLALLSFLFRYAYLYPLTGQLGFSSITEDNDNNSLPSSSSATSSLLLLPPWANAATFAVHTLLSLSAIIFRVPRKRLGKKLMIYEEYRLHSIVFTLRCLAVYLSAVYALPLLATRLLVAAHHLLADEVTRRHGTPGDTAVRTKEAEATDFHRRVAKFYSFYQFLAVASHITPSPHLADLGFNALIAIQSSSFLMTLYKKRIIRGRTHMIGYSVCLLVSAYHIVRLLGPVVFLMSLAAFYVRCQGVSKYIVWVAYCFALGFVDLDSMAGMSTLKLGLFSLPSFVASPPSSP